MCRRCTDVANLSKQVSLAEQEGIRNATQGYGFSISGLIQRWMARRRARSEHALLVASMPNLDNMPTTCVRCNAPAPRGRSLCDGCQAA